MEDNIPKFDIPLDFIVGDSITGEILNQYGRFPCKIKAGVFVLCVQGSVQATVNLTKFIIKPNDFITLPPGCFIQIHEVSARYLRQPGDASARTGLPVIPGGFFLADQGVFFA